jgi:hypothetical protein
MLGERWVEYPKKLDKRPSFVRAARAALIAFPRIVIIAPFDLVCTLL